MRILVTGASGFVGRHTVQLLRSRGDDVLAWGQSSPEGDRSITAVDLTRSDELMGQDLTELDAVIHLAGLAQVSASFDRPLDYITGNPAMEVNLLESLMAQHSFPRVLVVSSGGVYAGGSHVITEQSPVRAANPYVVSKLTQEIAAFYYRERGFQVIVARPFNHIGPGQERGYLVADIASQIAALERAAGGEIVAGNLETARDYTDVRDVASAYAELVIKGRDGEVYNVCSASSIRGSEIVDELLALARVPIRLAPRQALERPTETVEVRASNDKLRSETGWSPRIPIRTTLEDTLDFWRRRSSET